jgi:MFS family permease
VTVQRTYLLLTLLSTLAASFIWGINTLFLLDAGLNNAEAFAANAFFTAGMVIFEVPTGVLADMWGRRISYLLGAATLLLSTLLYLAMWQAKAPLWGWAIASVLIGLGFTFFSGATEAWLVDALAFSGFKENLESVLARGQVVGGAAMLTGSVAGGFIAQVTNLGVPYVIRSALLGLTLAAAFFLMKDLGFSPDRSRGPLKEVRRVVRASLDNGWRNPPVRWLMLAALCAGGVDIFAFYALQPYLLELYAVACLALIGWTSSFWVAIVLLMAWGLTFSAGMPIRQAYLNGIIPSQQRATVLSFDNLMASAGGAVAQPALGRAADVWGYPSAYVLCAGIQLLAMPFLFLARREDAPSDRIED